MASAAEVLSVFRKFDLNRDGVIDPNELTEVLQKLDPNEWPTARVEALLSAADSDRDGKIAYEEFVSWIFEVGELQEAIQIAAAQIAFPIEEAVVRELTWARTQPREVAQVLRGRLGHYKGKEYYPPERGGGCIVTKEGVAVVREAIKYLEALEPMGGVGVTSELGLALAGEDHVADIGQVGTASHASSDGTSSPDRALRYGSFGSFGECLWYGSDHSDARAMVLDLIVDDGVETRGHRHGVYNPVYDCVGVAYGPHSTFGRMTAMEFARAWTPDEAAIRERQQSGPVEIDPSIMAKAKAKATTHWTLGRCAICHEEIKGGRVVDVKEAGGKMHADCFKCSSCSKQLSGVPYKIHAGALFCSPCHAEKHADRCTACGEAISGGMMKCALGVFHIECVKCHACGNAIGRAKFSTASGVMTCQACSRGGLGANNSSAGSRGRSGSPRGRPGAKAAAASPKAKATPASPKAKVRAKAKAGVSMQGAKSVVTGLGMDYAALG